MVEFNFEEKEIKFCITNMEQINVITGDKFINRQLYYQLKESIKKAHSIDIILSFLMESGVRLILNDLKLAIDKGVKVRILTGNYLGITQPSALYLVKKELGKNVDLRFYNDKSRSFHPKAYIFHCENYSEIFIGSSNISFSALTSGIEWNYRFNDITDNESFNLFFNVFEDLFYNHSIVIDDNELYRYSKSWHKPALVKDLENQEEQETKLITVFEPRGVQIEALYALSDSRAEGAKKGLVHAATGVGKTYLAAFDSANYKRVLFVAHREEILKQAALAFKNVRKSDDYGFFYSKEKAIDKSMIFASVMTLGRTEYLNEKYFTKDYFDYIVIDEFHHAVTEQYKKIVEYFEPKFMLGLTATPERLDGKNIYELCDYNVPYEISLKDAINKGVLVPFHYYGIYDETDYSGLKLVKGKYDEKDLTKLYINNNKRYELIFKYYQKYKSKQALGFCCSRGHAEEMAREFCKRGIPSVAVYSNADGLYSEEREIAVKKLKNNEIRVIFSVDMFNEGLDIPSIDMVMFLRPTESPVVFLQQLGRGLRKYSNKLFLNVLDFIGNYEKAGKSTLLLSGERGNTNKKVSEYIDFEYPDNCIVDFDMRLIDLFKEFEKKHLNIKQKIQNEYNKVKELLNGRIPTRIELFTYMDSDIYEYCMKNSKENPFRQYLSFLQELNELTELEKEVYSGIGREFLQLIETTDMQKAYKMPILYAFYNHGNIKMQLKDEDVLKAWKEFFDKDLNWRDLVANYSYDEYKELDNKFHLKKAKTMPIHFLKASGKGFFIEKEGFTISLREELRPVIDNIAFKYHFKDILDYRTMEYYRRRYENNKMLN